MTTFLPSNHSSSIPKGRQVREQLHCIYEVNPTAGKPSAKLTSAGIRTGGIEGEIREGLLSSIATSHHTFVIRAPCCGQNYCKSVKGVQCQEQQPARRYRQQVSAPFPCRGTVFILQVANCDLFILGFSFLASPMRARSRIVATDRPLSERASAVRLMLDI